MYKVLVVDDEPIILSGIKYMIDWAEVDAEIVATARNGRDAYSFIKENHPDIVLTDIKMPIMNGLELLEKCSKEYPDIVFIILTSLEEFALAKEAIKYNASDYLLKTELDSDFLKKAIEKAKVEHSRRSGIINFELKQDTKSASIDNILQNLFLIKNIPAEGEKLLQEHGLLDNYALLAIFLDYPVSSLETSWKVSDYKRLYDWEGEVIKKIIPSALKEAYSVIPPAGKRFLYIYYVANIIPGTWPQVVSRIREKIAKASELVTGLNTEVEATHLYSGRNELSEMCEEVDKLTTRFYLEKKSFNTESLNIDVIFPKIERDIKKLDIPSLDLAFKEIRGAVEGKDHSINQIYFALQALQSSITSSLASIGALDEEKIKELFSLIPFLTHRKSVLLFLEDVSSEIEDIVSHQRGDKKSAITDRARSYILSHIQEHISLSSVADAANVSPGYMSQFFKKNMGISLVDYINQMKVQKAKELIKQGSDKINEIATILGYDNIYYFSKVFKKITGITPSEYIKDCSNDKE